MKVPKIKNKKAFQLIKSKLNRLQYILSRFSEKLFIGKIFLSTIPVQSKIV